MGCSGGGKDSERLKKQVTIMLSSVSLSDTSRMSKSVDWARGAVKVTAEPDECVCAVP